MLPYTTKDDRTLWPFPIWAGIALPIATIAVSILLKLFVQSVTNLSVPTPIFVLIACVVGVFGIVRYTDINLSQVVGLSGTPLSRQWLGCVLLGVSAWFVAASLSRWVTPLLPQQDLGGVQTVLTKDGLLWTIFAWSIAPAIGEEVLFRGWLQRSMARQSPTIFAIFISSIAFAILHGSVGRMIPTFILSIVFGLTFARTCHIGTSILIHALGNTSIILCLRYAELTAEGKGWSQAYYLAVLFFVLFFILGLWLLLGTAYNKPPPKQ